MSKTKPVEPQREHEEELPDVVPEMAGQIAIHESMDVDPRTGATVHIGVPERTDEQEVQDFLLWLQESADVENQDTMARIAENLRRASSATSIADLLRELPTVSGKDFVDRPFIAHKFSIHEGEFEDEELPYFASIDATDPRSGESFIANCGGEKVLVYLYWLQRNAEWPLSMCFTAKQTRKGRTILSLAIVEMPQK